MNSLLKNKNLILSPLRKPSFLMAQVPQRNLYGFLYKNFVKGGAQLQSDVNTPDNSQNVNVSWSS